MLGVLRRSQRVLRARDRLVEAPHRGQRGGVPQIGDQRGKGPHDAVRRPAAQDRGRAAERLDCGAKFAARVGRLAHTQVTGALEAVVAERLAARDEISPELERLGVPGLLPRLVRELVDDDRPLSAVIQ